MRNRVSNLNHARVLISNDDGVDAPGIKALEKAMKRLGCEVWIVAPESEQSATSHSLTLRRPLRIRKISKQKFAIDGTPTDTILLGVQEVMKDCPPDLIVSGINRGGNLGEDITYSGTVAAAMEGTLLDIPSIAFSLVTPDGVKAHWGTAEEFAMRVLKKIANTAFPKGVLLNVNIPNCKIKDVTGMESTRQGQRKIGCEIKQALDPRDKPYYWIGAQREEDRTRPGTDLEAIARNAVSIAPISMDMHHGGMAKRLNAVFE